MINVNSIKDRASYLKFRTDWKHVYMALSSEIRATKKIARAKAWTPERPIARDQDACEAAQSRLVGLKAKARTMMDELEQAKSKRPIRVAEAA